MNIAMDNTIADTVLRSKDWDERRNAAVATLIASKPLEIRPNSKREEQNEALAQMALMARKPRGKVDLNASEDARLYEGISRAIELARDDERKRFSLRIASAMQALLGEDFRDVMYDIALKLEINIGSD